MNTKDMNQPSLRQLSKDLAYIATYMDRVCFVRTAEECRLAAKECTAYADEADALRKENEELKAQNLLIRGDNADLLANADAYSFNISNMHTKMLQLLEENVELRKDKDKLLKDYAELKVNAALLVACDDALESLAAEEAKESEASHE